MFHQESAGKTLEEMDFLFTKDRTSWVFLDREATKIGAIFERDMAHGEALTTFDRASKVAETAQVAHIDDINQASNREV